METKKARIDDKTNQRNDESPCSILQLPMEIKVDIFSYLTYGELVWDVGFTCKDLFDLVYGKQGIIEVYQDGMHRDKVADDRIWGARKLHYDLVDGKLVTHVKINKRNIKFADDLDQVLKWKEIIEAVKYLIICPVNAREEILTKMNHNIELTGEECVPGLTLLILRDRDTSLDMWQKEEVFWLQGVITKIFNKCHHIDSVYVNGCKLPITSIPEIKSNVKLLDLSGCSKVTLCLENITLHCSQLTYLDLSNCGWLSNSDIAFVTENCKQLIALNLNQCWRITCDGVISLVKHCCMLKELYIWKVRMTKKCYRYLRKMYCDIGCERLKIEGRVKFIQTCADYS